MTEARQIEAYIAQCNAERYASLARTFVDQLHRSDALYAQRKAAEWSRRARVAMGVE